MSTGLECNFFETKGQWLYMLMDYDCPRNAWDWREYATTYGPFVSEEAANKHLRDNHANPGGSSTQEYGDQPLDEVITKAVAEAKKPEPARRLSGFMVLGGRW